MRKKSNKSSMHKENSIILAFFVISALISGCGIKGPLTQPTPEAAPVEQNNNSEANSETTHSDQTPKKVSDHNLTPQEK
jgi:predicted small lipoprotein YifL